MFKYIIPIIITGLLLFSACQKSQENNVVKVVPVQVMKLSPDSISSFLEITGNLRAGNDAYVFSTITEKLVRIIRNVGARVKKDEIIAEFDNKIWKEALNQAQAALESMQARQEQIKQDYVRYERLYKEDAVSQQQWEKIRSSMQEADANIAQLEAQYAQAKQKFDDTYIRAPFDGVVGSLLYDVGETVPMGQPVAKIINTNLMKAKLNIPDIHMNKIHPEQAVYADFPALPDKHFKGIINRIDPAIDPVSRTIEVEAIFENQNNELKSGMYGLFHIEIGKSINSIVIPDNAVINRTEVKVNNETGATYTEIRHYVFIAQNDSAKMVEVHTGLASGDKIEISHGLQFGEDVIIVGQKIVKDGQKVDIITDRL
jgi:membrane fusion protein (multidrug efflux system)